MNKSPDFHVLLSVFGRFHAFQAALEMQKRDVLKKFFISYPFAPEGISPQIVRNQKELYTLCWLLSRILPQGDLYRGMHDKLTQLFDKRVSKKMKQLKLDGKPTLLHGWASYSLNTFIEAKKRGWITFLDYSCPHPITKLEVLSAEAERLGEKFHAPQSWVRQVKEECDLTDYIVVPSKYVLNSFIEHGFSKDKLILVPLGVSESEFFEMERVERGAFRVLTVGTDPLRKGVYDLLKAYDLLKLKNANLTVRCGVPDSVFPLLERVGAEYIPPISHLHRQKLLDLYRSADIFCFTSISDGFGLVVLEAMAQGLPVITTDNVGASDCITDGIDGFVVPARNHEAVAEKIELLYKNRELRYEMGRNALKKAKKYTWHHYGDNLFEAYSKGLKCKIKALPQTN